jgi:hypothetical protein
MIFCYEVFQFASWGHQNYYCYVTPWNTVHFKEFSINSIGVILSPKTVKLNSLKVTLQFIFYSFMRSFEGRVRGRPALALFDLLFPVSARSPTKHNAYSIGINFQVSICHVILLLIHIVSLNFSSTYLCILYFYFFVNTKATFQRMEYKRIFLNLFWIQNYFETNDSDITFIKRRFDATARIIFKL